MNFYIKAFKKGLMVLTCSGCFLCSTSTKCGLFNWTDLANQLERAGKSLLVDGEKGLMRCLVAGGLIATGVYTSCYGVRMVMEQNQDYVKRFGMGFGLVSLGIIAIGFSPYVAKMFCKRFTPLTS